LAKKQKIVGIVVDILILSQSNNFVKKYKIVLEFTIIKYW